MIKYVCGFAFTEDGKQVLLISKNRPEWQRGRLNGVGGKIESFDKSPAYAMVREFEEETGLKTKPDQWDFLISLSNAGINESNEKNWRVNFFYIFLHKIGYLIFFSANSGNADYRLQEAYSFCCHGCVICCHCYLFCCKDN